MSTTVASVLTKLGEVVLPKLLDLISEPLKEAITSGINSLYAKALESDNEWDNVVVELIAEIMSIELEDSDSSDGTTE